MPLFQSYSDIMAHLDKLGLFHMDFTLGRMKDAIAAFGLEKPGFAIIQVVGTNGKGSTSSFLAAIAEKHGLKTGLFTSPHFVSPRERIVINGFPATEEDWLAPARLVHEKAPNLTYFEFLTVLSLLIFREKSVDLVVMEAGLGGRFDATTAAWADLTCFTSIDMDHEAVLGKNLGEIASDKAGAMRLGLPAVSAPQRPDARHALELAATEKNVELEFCAPLADHSNCGPERNAVVTAVEDELDMSSGRFKLGLRGPHQAINAGLAVRAWEVFCRKRGITVNGDLVRQALASAFIPGRLQLVAPDPAGGHGHMLLDGAHNPAGLAALEAAVLTEGLRPSAVIFSCLGDKDVSGLAGILNSMLDKIGGNIQVLVPVIADNPRAAEPAELAALLRGRGRPTRGLEDALSLARPIFSSPSSPHILCGSLYLLAEFYALWPGCLLRTLE